MMVNLQLLFFDQFGVILFIGAKKMADFFFEKLES
jgi:hypothetical protein